MEKGEKSERSFKEICNLQKILKHFPYFPLFPTIFANSFRDSPHTYTFCEHDLSSLVVCLCITSMLLFCFPSMQIFNSFVFPLVFTQQVTPSAPSILYLAPCGRFPSPLRLQISWLFASFCRESLRVREKSRSVCDCVLVILVVI